MSGKCDFCDAPAIGTLTLNIELPNGCSMSKDARVCIECKPGFTEYLKREIPKGIVERGLADGVTFDDLGESATDA